MRSGDCGRTPAGWLASRAVDPIALRSELDLLPVFGERLRRRAPMLVEDRRVREESGTVLLRLSSQPREARLWLEGERHTALDLTIVPAIIYTVLTLEALMSLGASTGGAGARA
jgi:hypothetical protein